MVKLQLFNKNLNYFIFEKIFSQIGNLFFFQFIKHLKYDNTFSEKITKPVSLEEKIIMYVQPNTHDNSFNYLLAAVATNSFSFPSYLFTTYAYINTSFNQYVNTTLSLDDSKHSGVIVTKRGVVLTKCGVTLTKCGAVLTKCGVILTKCGVVSTKCGVASTKCGVVLTKCGVASTKCGAVLTKCGAVSTKYGVVSTKYEVISTKYKINKLNNNSKKHELWLQN